MCGLLSKGVSYHEGSCGWHGEAPGISQSYCLQLLPLVWCSGWHKLVLHHPLILHTSNSDSRPVKISYTNLAMDYMVLNSVFGLALIKMTSLY